MFDVIDYARDNEVSVEIIPLIPSKGFKIHIKDLVSDADAYAILTPEDLNRATKPDILIEKTCDNILAVIGKYRRIFRTHADASAHMREIESFFREPVRGTIEKP